MNQAEFQDQQRNVAERQQQLEKALLVAHQEHGVAWTAYVAEGTEKTEATRSRLLSAGNASATARFAYNAAKRRAKK